jgi:hypothetical protein
MFHPEFHPMPVRYTLLAGQQTRPLLGFETFCMCVLDFVQQIMLITLAEKFKFQVFGEKR